MNRSVSALSAALLFVLAGVSTTTAVDDAVHPWIATASDPAALHAQVESNRDKVPLEFERWLDHALPDGSLRVIVTAQRDAGVDALVEENTLATHWIHEDVGFIARVTADQLGVLLADPAVEFVVPDHPLTYNLGDSTDAINARSDYNSGTGTGAGTGVWYFDPTVSATTPMGSLESDVSGHPAYTGKGVTVAVIDSGVDGTHRDFGGWDCAAGAYQPCDSRIKENIKTEHLLIGTNLGYDNLLPTTDLVSGHGTHVSGIIAGNGYYARNGAHAGFYGGDGRPIGVAPEADLVVLSNGDTLWAGLASDALGHLYGHMLTGQPHFQDVKVISQSWGCLGGCSYNAGNVINVLSRLFYLRDVVVVFAAGNDGCGNVLSGYSESPYVLSVAAYGDSAGSVGPRASFSSCGNDNTVPAASSWDPAVEAAGTTERRPDIAAPGVSIYSAASLTGGAASGAPRVTTSDAIGGASVPLRPYVTMSGTSMATPHVSGAVALLFDKCPNASALDVMRAIMDNAIDMNGPFGNTPKQVGYGALDTRASLDALC